jgi:hypothetical protein
MRGQARQRVEPVAPVPGARETPAMHDVPRMAKARGRSNTPSASMAPRASLQPTATGTPAGMPNRALASPVTVPRGSQGSAVGGHTAGSQPAARRMAAAGAPVRTLQIPLLDQRSDAGEPVSAMPTKSLACSTQRVAAAAWGRRRASQASWAGG